MRLREIGEHIVLEVIERDNSVGCAECFFHTEVGCGVNTMHLLPCSHHNREDGKDVCYKEILNFH